MDEIEELRRKKIAKNKERTEREYWIDRCGYIVKLKGEHDYTITSFHSEIAQQLFPESKDAKNIIKKLGYVCVGSVVYDSPVIDKMPTQAQINTLDRLGLLEYLKVLDGSYYVKYTKINQY